MKKIEIKCSLKLLEDFHIGTGSGNIGLYDDGQFKDKLGLPLINSSTIKGLLRDSCSQLDRMRERLGVNEASWYERIFESHEDMSSLDIQIEPDGFPENPTIIHFFTAVDNEKRKSRDGSLRSVEFGSRGSRFKLRLSYVTRDEDAEGLMEYLIQGLQNIKALGGHRRRGFGAVSVAIEDKKVSFVESSEESWDTGRRVEILLELEEDAILSSKAQSGNLLFTNDYIPGSTILGLLRSLALRGNCRDDFLDDGHVGSSFFYPLPDTVKDPFELNVCPVSLSLRRLKLRKSSSEDTAKIPVWALDMEKSSSFKHILSHDVLEETTEERDSGKSMYEGYVYADKGDHGWQESGFFTISKVYHQRNLINRSTQSTSENGIFIEEKVAAGTRFMGALTFASEELCARFLAFFQPWLSGSQPIHLGKGGKIARVREYKVLSPPVKTAGEFSNKFTLTLLSDAVLLTPALSHAKTIGPELMAEMLGEGFSEDDFICGPSVLRHGVVSSFSGTSGLRKFRDIAIRKGSAFSFEYRGTDLGLFKQRLNQLEERGIGLRRNEGFGVIAINHPLHFLKAEKSIAPPSLGGAHISERESERLEKLAERHREAQKLKGELKKVGLKRNWRSMVGDLILDLEANNKYERIILKLEAKMDQDSEHGSWKTSDARYELAKIIMPWLRDDVERATLSEALKLLLQES